jgi:hypothetical protein
MGNIPTELQTSLSGRANATYFVGCSEQHNDAIKLFNPTTKRVILRDSFKYLSDVESSSTTFVFPEDNSTASPISNSNILINEPPMPTSPDKDEFTFISLPKSKAPAAYKFSYNFLNHSFLDKTSNSNYMSIMLSIYQLLKLKACTASNTTPLLILPLPQYLPQIMSMNQLMSFFNI